MTRPVVNISVGRERGSQTTPKSLIQLTEDMDRIEQGLGNHPHGYVRPTLTANDIGYSFFDTFLGRPVWWNGLKWVDASGNDTPSPVVPDYDPEPEENLPE